MADISFDSAKSERNVLVRGVPFKSAAEYAWDVALIVEDLRKDYGERRFQELGLIGNRLHKMVFTPRANKARVISLGKANKREAKRYEAPAQSQKADRENPAWTKETFARARKARDALPEIFGRASAAKMLKPRGRPKSGRARTSISIRLPPETLARWKATGPGWQTRMAKALSRAV